MKNYVYDKVAQGLRAVVSKGKEIKNSVIEGGKDIIAGGMHMAKDAFEGTKAIAMEEGQKVLKGAIQGGIDGALANRGSFKDAAKGALDGANVAFQVGVGDAIRNVDSAVHNTYLGGNEGI